MANNISYKIIFVLQEELQGQEQETVQVTSIQILYPYYMIVSPSPSRLCILAGLGSSLENRESVVMRDWENHINYLAATFALPRTKRISMFIYAWTTRWQCFMSIVPQLFAS